MHFVKHQSTVEEGEIDFVDHRRVCLSLCFDHSHAYLQVNKQLLPRSERERERCSRTVYMANIDERLDAGDVRRFFSKFCGAHTPVFNLFSLAAGSGLQFCKRQECCRTTFEQVLRLILLRGVMPRSAADMSAVLHRTRSIFGFTAEILLLQGISWP